MEWRQFVMHLDALPADDVEAVFLRHGALAVTLSDAGDAPVLEPPPGETPLWLHTRITGLFPASLDIAALRADLEDSFALDELPPQRLETLEDRAWEREWLINFRPMRFGRRLWVCPGGFTIDAADAVVLHLDPGLAFGTGTHPTTALSLEWLDGLEASGLRVLDYGSGSGILAIAALLLGAAHATALDIDPQAITATRRNSVRNKVDTRLATTLDAEGLNGEFDVVLANILSDTLTRDAAIICGLLVSGGSILLSGILDGQAGTVQHAYREWIVFDPPVVRDSWVRLTGKKR